MKRFTLLSVVLSVFFLALCAPFARAETTLTADVVRAVFSAQINEEGNPYDLDPASISFREGSFTRPGAREALVWFFDRNQSHAAGWAELWLMRDDGGWKSVMVIEQSDRMDARLIDAGGKGISAVFLTATHQATGGFVSSYWALVSLYGGTPSTLYSADGSDFAFWDMYKEFGQGQGIILHQIGFRDVWGDSAMELIDTELSGTFVKTGKGESGYEVRWTPAATTTYRLVVDKDGVIKRVEKID